MADRIICPNGPDILVLEEVIIGSQLRIAAYIEQETGFQTGIFNPYNFTGVTLACDVRDDLRSGSPVASFTCTPRVGQPGWVDLLLDGTATLALYDHDYKASLKVWPTSSPQLGDTLMVILMPMKFAGTR